MLGSRQICKSSYYLGVPKKSVNGFDVGGWNAAGQVIIPDRHTDTAGYHHVS